MFCVEENSRRTKCKVTLMKQRLNALEHLKLVKLYCEKRNAEKSTIRIFRSLL